MGRPALNMTRTHISFAPETLARMDRLVGEKGRAPFVRQAVDHLLDAMEAAQKIAAETKRRAE